MASEEAIQKLKTAIIEKRRELGFVEKGMIPVQEVVERLKVSSSNCTNLAKHPADHQSDDLS